MSKTLKPYFRFLTISILLSTHLWGVGCADTSLNEGQQSLGSTNADSEDDSDSLIEVPDIELNKILPEGADHLVAINEAKIGQNCDLSAYSGETRRNLNFNNASENIKIEIKQKSLGVFHDPRLLALVIGQLNGNTFETAPGSGNYNHTLIAQVLSMGSTATTACTVTSPELKAQVKSGKIPLAQAITKACTQLSATRSIEDDVNNNDEQRVYEALIDLLSQERYASQVIDKLLPYSATIKDVVNDRASYITFSLGLLTISAQTFPILSRQHVEQSAQHWEGYLGFIFNTAQDKRCDYQRILDIQ